MSAYNHSVRSGSVVVYGPESWPSQTTNLGDEGEMTHRVYMITCLLGKKQANKQIKKSIIKSIIKNLQEIIQGPLISFNKVA